MYSSTPYDKCNFCGELKIVKFFHLSSKYTDKTYRFTYCYDCGIRGVDVDARILKDELLTTTIIDTPIPKEKADVKYNVNIVKEKYGISEYNQRRFWQDAFMAYIPLTRTPVEAAVAASKALGLYNKQFAAEK